MCVDFIITSNDKKIAIVGRSMEWIGFPFVAFMYFQNKGKLFKYGANTELKNKYAYVAIANGINIPKLQYEKALDGMNEQGLTCDLLFFPKFCVYPKLPKKLNKNENYVNVLNFTEYILGHFSNCDEIIDAFNKKQLYIYGDKFGVEEDLFAAHWQIFDRSGKGIVIECLKDTNLIKIQINGSGQDEEKQNEYNNGDKGGYVSIHESCGVMTNAPFYSYHLANINNYAHLTNKVSKEVEKQENGQGGGMVGLPGDTTPPSRFVRVKIFKDSVEKEKKLTETVEEAVKSTYHILNSTDIPKGVTIHGINGYDFTVWDDIKDLNNLKLYYRTYNDAGFTCYDFNKYLKENPKEGDFKHDLKNYARIINKWSDVNNE